MDDYNKKILQKYILNECTPEEMEEVIKFFQKSTEQDVEKLPSYEEVLKAIGEKEKLDPRSTKRIYKNIISLSEQKRSRSLRFKTRAITRLAVAAIFIGIICTGLFLNQNQSNENGSLIAPAENFVTLISEDGEETILENTDSLLVKDKEGNILGLQKGTSIVYHSSKEETTSLRYNTISVPHGKRFELSLSDGTRVYLNAGSSFRFPVNFVKGNNREVFLMGETFFEVSKNESHPFVVQTENLGIEVLGTEFNVEAYQSLENPSVILVEGKVRVDNQKGENLVMSPNEKVSFNNGSLLKSEVEASHLTSWKDGYLTITEASVFETVQILERYYNIQIQNEDQPNLDKIVGSGKVYLSENVANVIETLSLLTNNNYSYRYNETPSK